MPGGWGRSLWVALWWAVGVSGGSGAAQRPLHVIHLVADDVGFNDQGWTNDIMITPHLNALAFEGVRLERLYTSKDCAPSRGSVLTGRYPFRFGYYRNPSDEGGVMLNFTLLPEILRSEAGYATHAVGKWHLGFKNESYTATMRGFDSFLGYYHWGEEYADHMFPPYYKGDQPCRGLDLADNHGTSIAPASDSTVGEYSTNLFVSRAVDIIHNHSDQDSNKPLFLYLAFQNVHDPYESAPAEYVSLYENAIDDAARRNLSALMTLMDDGVKNITDALKQTNMLENSLIIFHSDNGGELPLQNATDELPGGAGNNYPLRGGKFTLWEGGIRTRGFVYTPRTDLLPRSRRGAVWSGLVHLTDFLPTILDLVGVSTDKAVGPYDLDGKSFWTAMVEDAISARWELLHQPLNQHWNGSCWTADLANPYQPACGASITFWPHKFLFGFPGDARVVAAPEAKQPPRGSLLHQTHAHAHHQQQLHPHPHPHLQHQPQHQQHQQQHSQQGTALLREDLSSDRSACTERPFCLYNIEEDPTESVNLASRMPGLALSLLARIYTLSENGPEPACGTCTDGDPPSDAECAVVDSTGFWQPWENE